MGFFDRFIGPNRKEQAPAQSAVSTQEAEHYTIIKLGSHRASFEGKLKEYQDRLPKSPSRDEKLLTEIKIALVEELLSQGRIDTASFFPEIETKFPDSFIAPDIFKEAYNDACGAIRKHIKKGIVKDEKDKMDFTDNTLAGSFAE